MHAMLHNCFMITVDISMLPRSAGSSKLHHRIVIRVLRVLRDERGDVLHRLEVAECRSFVVWRPLRLRVLATRPHCQSVGVCRAPGSRTGLKLILERSCLEEQQQRLEDVEDYQEEGKVLPCLGRD